jgi:hypothetical protein
MKLRALALALLLGACVSSGPVSYRACHHTRTKTGSLQHDLGRVVGEGEAGKVAFQSPYWGRVVFYEKKELTRNCPLMVEDFLLGGNR